MKKLTILLLFISSVSRADLFTAELMWKLGRVSDPQLSPDGRTVVYNITRYDVEANKGNADIYLYDFQTGTTRMIAGDPANEYQARWNADGSRIYFLSDAEGDQLWSMKPDGSDKKQESRVEGAVGAFGLSADGKMLWYAVEVQTDTVDSKELYGDLPKSTGRMYDDLMMRHWNTWEDGRRSHIFIAEMGKGLITAGTDIMKGEDFDSPMKPFGGDEQIMWSPDGKTLAYTCKKSSGKEYAMLTNSEIWLYDVSSGKTTNLTEGIAGYDRNPLYSPDGKYLAWQSMEEAGNEADRPRIMLYDIASKSKQELLPGTPHYPEGYAWSSDSRRIYFLAHVNATEQVFYSNIGSGQAVQLTRDTADHYSITVAGKEGKDRIVTARMTFTAPSDLYAVESSGVTKQLTFTNKDVLAGVEFGEVKKMLIRATDGKQIHTWVLYPPNFNPSNKYPALLYCQGGPQSPLSQFFSYRWNLALMASHGYIVVAPNRRGMPGFGEAWNDEISGDWGGQPMKDLLSSIDSVAKYPYVNKDRLGAVGASYGGFTTFWLAGNHNKRFKAFISHCGVFNFEAMAGTEELFFWIHENEGPYWRVPEPKNYSFSPHRFAGRWDTPMLIISNERDYRIPYSQGLEAYTVLRMKNIPGRFISFPDEGHWVLKPQNSLFWHREFYRFLDKYLKH